MVVRRAFISALGAAALLTISDPAAAAPIVLDGDVPTDGPDHFFLDFDVPDGIQEIAIKHDDLSEANILDFGLDDPDGYRGWGGGTSEDTIVAVTAASRAYVAGPIKPGKWRVVVGKAKVVESPAKYHVEIDLRTTQTLASTEALRKPYQAATPRATELRYYAGDFHVHDLESTDADPPLSKNVALAKSRGLDFMEASDHNTITQMDYFWSLQDHEPTFLLIPGIEYTTYKGHANAIGATKWVDHKIGQPGVTIDGAVDQITAQGALFAINHPVIDVGNLCIGCKWEHDLDPSKVTAVEIGTKGLSYGGSLFSTQAIAFWDKMLDTGAHVTPIGGSDDHDAGASTGFLGGKVGSPTTMVRAKELSVAGILEGVEKGATVVKLDGPDDPMVELEAGDGLAFPGDTLGVRSVVLHARVTKGAGNQVRLVKNGQPLDPVDIDEDPFDFTMKVEPPSAGEDRWRAEVMVDEKPRTVSSHIWLRLDPNGPAAPEAADDGGGCNTTGGDANASVPFLLGLAITAARRWRHGARGRSAGPSATRRACR